MVLFLEEQYHPTKFYWVEITAASWRSEINLSILFYIMKQNGKKERILCVAEYSITGFMIFLKDFWRQKSSLHCITSKGIATQFWEMARCGFGKGLKFLEQSFSKPQYIFFVFCVCELKRRNIFNDSNILRFSY